ncbi:MAG: hypothetical protein ACOYUZ_00920 [Patescibacteria group bacterium]
MTVSGFELVKVWETDNSFYDWRVYEDKIFINRPGTRIEDRQLVCGNQVLYSGRIDGFCVSEGKIFIQQGCWGDICKILRGEHELYTGPLNYWRVSGGKIFIQRGLAHEIVCGNQVLYSGPMNSWQVSEGKIYIGRGYCPITISCGEQVLFSGWRCNCWNVSEGKIFIQQGSNRDPECQILCGDRILYTGSLASWRVSDGKVYILIEEDVISTFYRLEKPINPWAKPFG